MWKIEFALICLASLFTAPGVYAAPWIATDWADREPHFPPGSLFWMTNEYPRCPVLYRTVLEVDDKPLAFAGFRARVSGFAFVFLNGRRVASHV